MKATKSTKVTMTKTEMLSGVEVLSTKYVDGEDRIALLQRAGWQLVREPKTKD